MSAREPQRSLGRRPWLALLVLVYVAWGAVYIERTSLEGDAGRVFTLWDDAMISMRYARNLHAGEGLVWNAGEAPVQGFTNLGVTLAMAGVHALPVATPHVAGVFQGLTLILLAGSLLGIHRLARQTHPDEPAVADGTAVAFALCGPVAIWGLQGSDVAFVTAWITAAAVLATAPTLRRGALLAVLGAGLFLRPDAALLYPWPLLAAQRIHGRGARLLLPGAVVGAVCVGAFGLFGRLYYGDWLPNTYYLKATGQPRALMLVSGLEELVSWLPYLAIPIALAVYGAWPRRRDPAIALLAALFAFPQLYNTWVGGDFVFGYGARFAVPTLPFALLLAVAGAARLADRLSSPRRSIAVVVAGALLGWGIALPAASREWLDPRRPTLLRQQNANNLRFAEYLRRHTDPSLTLGAHWGGVPPYFSERPAIDVLGKSDRHIARLVVDRFQAGHSKWDWEYVLHTRRPDVLRAPSRGLGRREDFRALYWRVQTEVGLDFYLRRESLSKLRDRAIRLTDLNDGRRFRPTDG